MKKKNANWSQTINESRQETIPRQLNIMNITSTCLNEFCIHFSLSTNIANNFTSFSIYNRDIIIKNQFKRKKKLFPLLSIPSNISICNHLCPSEWLCAHFIGVLFVNWRLYKTRIMQHKLPTDKNYLYEQCHRQQAWNVVHHTTVSAPRPSMLSIARVRSHNWPDIIEMYRTWTIRSIQCIHRTHACVMETTRTVCVHDSRTIMNAQKASDWHSLPPALIHSQTLTPNDKIGHTNDVQLIGQTASNIEPNTRKANDEMDE